MATLWWHIGHWSNGSQLVSEGGHMTGVAVVECAGALGDCTPTFPSPPQSRKTPQSGIEVRKYNFADTRVSIILDWFLHDETENICSCLSFKHLQPQCFFVFDFLNGGICSFLDFSLVKLFVCFFHSEIFLFSKRGNVIVYIFLN